jgi:hypothetical protein
MRTKRSRDVVVAKKKKEEKKEEKKEKRLTCQTKNIETSWQWWSRSPGFFSSRA